MTLFIDPQFCLSLSFLICMGFLSKVLWHRIAGYIDHHMHQRQQLLQTLRQEEKTLQALLKQEKQRAIIVAEERKMIKQQLKEQISALRSSMQDRVKHDIMVFEENYEKLHQSMVADFDYYLKTTLIRNALESTRIIMRQPSMQKYQYKIAARQLKNLQ